MSAPAPSNLKISCAEYMLSTTAGLGVSQTWLPLPVTQAFLQSINDGQIQISPDPVNMIVGDMTWFNSSKDPVMIWVSVHRAPRAITVQDPCTIIITDGWTSQIGANPTAGTPSVNNDWFGGKLMIDRPATPAKNLKYGRYFLEGDDTVTYVPVGVVPPGQQFQFRYRAAVQTPGVWTEPSDFQGEYRAYSFWTRLVALGFPVGSGGGISYMAPTTRPFTNPATTTWRTPLGVTYLYLVGIGGGGSGQGTLTGLLAQGGLHGVWNSVALSAGTDFIPGVTAFTITPGLGGAAVFKNSGNGHAGGATTVTWTDPSAHARTFTCAGGAGGSSSVDTGYKGQAPPVYTFNTVNYVGGAAALPAFPGNPPGGGGGGAVFFEQMSGAGAPGAVYAVVGA